MLKKKMAALLIVLMTAIALVSVTKAYAAETYTEKSSETNLKLDNTAAKSVKSVAGGKVHMEVTIRLKEGYCIEPEFTFTAHNASLSFENIKVRNANDRDASWIYIDTTESVVLEYDVLIDDFAKIGKCTYDISYNIPKDFYDDEDVLDEDLIEPGNLTMEISVVNEKIPPQMSIVSGAEHHVKAGETLELQFTMENEGELKALDTYVEADYSAFDRILIPKYTPLKQKIGSMSLGQTKGITFTYKVAENAKTEVIKLPISITYKLENGAEENAVAYVYIYVEGKPEVTPTPTPTPQSKSAMLLLNSVKQSPSKPEAGEKVTVSFYLQNAGDADAKNVKLVPTGLSSSGFEPVSSDPSQYIGHIKAGKKQKVELTLRVGDNIPEGLNTLNVAYSYEVEGDYGTTTESETVTLYILDVQNPDESEMTISRPKLMVSDFYTDVEEVKAGGVFDFTFEIMNTNDSIDAKNIKVTVSGASNAFSVTAGGNSFFINAIKAQEKAPITINLKASAAATTGAYPIQIKIEYEYEGMISTATYSGEVVEEEILLQVKENLRPSVENVYVGSWDTPIVNQPTTMNFEFYNMGKSTLNNTYVTIEGDFMLSNGSNSYYIGNIAAGMPEYIEFDVVPLVEGNALGKMIIHMEDSNGDEVTMEKEFTAYVMGETMWEDPGYMDPGYMDPGYMDPSVPVDGDVTEKPILPLWLFLCIQGAILAIGIPVTRAIRLAAYRSKIKREDAI